MFERLKFWNWNKCSSTEVGSVTQADLAALTERMDSMSQVQSQLSQDVAQNKSLTLKLAALITTALGAFAAAVSNQASTIADLKQQLAAAQANGTPVDPSVLTDLEADNATLQKSIDDTSTALAALNPPATGGTSTGGDGNTTGGDSSGTTGGDPTGTTSDGSGGATGGDVNTSATN